MRAGVPSAAAIDAHPPHWQQCMRTAGPGAGAWHLSVAVGDALAMLVMDQFCLG